jgi:hypothetical protein
VVARAATSPPAARCATAVTAVRAHMHQHPDLPAAIVVRVGDGDQRATVEAIEQQTQRPSTIMQTVRAGSAASAAASAEWWWLVGDDIVPNHDALERLLEARARVKHAGAPSLFASRVLTPDGVLDQASAPVAEVHRPERVLAATENHLVAIRATPGGSLLVRRGCVLRHGGIAASSAGNLRWTARMLAGETGVLVPESIAVRVRRRGVRLDLGSIRDALGLIRDLERRERIWFALHLAEQTWASLPARGRFR